MPIFLFISILETRLRKRSWDFVLIKTVFYLYLLFLMDATLMPLPLGSRADRSETKLHNFVPFLSTYLILKSPFGLTVGLINIFHKATIFFPLGLLSPLVSGTENLSAVTKTGLIIALFIEIVQGFIDLLLGFNYRSMDVDEVILALLGTLAGFVIFRAAIKPLLERNGTI